METKKLTFLFTFLLLTGGTSSTFCMNDKDIALQQILQNKELCNGIRESFKQTGLTPELANIVAEYNSSKHYKTLEHDSPVVRVRSRKCRNLVNNWVKIDTLDGKSYSINLQHGDRINLPTKESVLKVKRKPDPCATESNSFFIFIKKPIHKKESIFSIYDKDFFLVR